VINRSLKFGRHQTRRSRIGKFRERLLASAPKSLLTLLFQGRERIGTADLRLSRSAAAKTSSSVAIGIAILGIVSSLPEPVRSAAF